MPNAAKGCAAFSGRGGRRGHERAIHLLPCPLADHQPGTLRVMVKANDRVVQPDHHVGHIQTIGMAGGQMFQLPAQLIAKKPDGTAAERQRCGNGRAATGRQFAGEQTERIARMHHAVHRDDAPACAQRADRIEADIARIAAGIALRRTVEKDKIRLARQSGEAIFRHTPGYFLDEERDGDALVWRVGTL